MKKLFKTPDYFKDIPEEFGRDLSDDYALVEWGYAPPGLNLDKCLFVAGSLNPSEIIFHMINHKLNHIVQKESPFFLSDLFAAAKIMKEAQLYFATPGQTILGSYQHSIAIRFSAPKDKDMLWQKAEAFMRPLVRQSVMDSFLAVLEELYMNAILDAPREHQKVGFKNSPYAEGHEAEIQIYLDDKRILVSCMDPFGSLNINAFIKRLNEVYTSGAARAMNLGDGGAGLGCLIMFEKCSSMYLGVKPGLVTQVSCCLPYKMNNRDASSLQKGLHILNVIKI